jgi:K+-transporting ATPase ATPase B chain
LDKTGTITIGNRKATHFYPAPNQKTEDFVEAVVLSSLVDETPEGKSVIELASQIGYTIPKLPMEAKAIPFTAETRASGVDLGILVSEKVLWILSKIGLKKQEILFLMR